MPIEPRAGEADMVDHMYRVMAGGSEVFLQVADEKDALEFVARLRYKVMATDELAETLTYYFPQVLRACVYASEGGVDDADIDEILGALCPDISALIEGRGVLQAQISTDCAIYTLRCDDFWGITLIADFGDG